MFGEMRSFASAPPPVWKAQMVRDAVGAIESVREASRSLDQRRCRRFPMPLPLWVAEVRQVSSAC
jgi:hypothetical protein